MERCRIIPEIVQIVCNRRYSENVKQKHRYDVRFALPVYSDKTGEVERYNIYIAVMLVRHSEDNMKYLYDIISIKKETSSPLES